MEKVANYTVTKDEQGTRLDKFLAAKLPHLSRSLIKKSIDKQHVFVNGENVKASYKLVLDDVVLLKEIELQNKEILAEFLPLDIVYEDDDLMVINKERGIVVHPAPGNYKGTLVNALIHKTDQLSNIAGEDRPGIVHRLDKDTSGLILIAKNNEAHKYIAKQLKENSVIRTYYAIVHGIINEDEGVIDVPIGRDPNNRVKMTSLKKGKNSITNFKVLERYEDFTLVQCNLKTGRTHQIRVHMRFINHPIAGDTTYGYKKTLKGNGQYLHAKEISLIHPSTKKRIIFESELPPYFKEAIIALKNQNK